MARVHFDDMEVGQVFRHTLSRTITEMDNVLFTSMTRNPALLHLERNIAGMRRSSVSASSTPPSRRG